MKKVMTILPLSIIRAGIVGLVLAGGMSRDGMAAIYPDQAGGVSPLFASDSLLHITLLADFRTFVFDVGEDPSWHEARLILDRGGEQPLEFGVKLRTRGNFRRNRDVCDFPPIRIDFDKDETSGSVFEGQDKLKIVTHCRNSLEAYEQFYIQEYLLYRIYNLITDLSYWVRPALITYIDTTGRTPEITRFAFFLEDDDDLAERNNGVIANIQGIAQYKIDYYQINTFTVFQYFIGNTDWSIPELHNVDLFSPGEGGPLEVIPYDFDFAGVINAPYAIPDPKLPIGSVRQRLFRSFCRERDELQPVFDRFIEQKQAIYNLYNEMPLLNNRTRNSALKYYDAFYKTLNNEKKIEREFLRTCRGKEPDEEK